MSRRSQDLATLAFKQGHRNGELVSLPAGIKDVLTTPARPRTKSSGPPGARCRLSTAFEGLGGLAEHVGDERTPPGRTSSGCIPFPTSRLAAFPDCGGLDDPLDLVRVARVLGDETGEVVEDAAEIRIGVASG
jgi:hypothetical protein